MELHYYDLNTYEIFTESGIYAKLCSHDTLSPIERACLREIWAFHAFRGNYIYLSQARDLCGYSELTFPESAWINEKRELAINKFYFGESTSAYYAINPVTGLNEPTGIDLKYEVAPSYKDPKEVDYYFRLFVFRAITLVKEYPLYFTNFMNYHLRTAFDGNKINFKTFLLTHLGNSSHILGNYKELWHHYATDVLPIVVDETSDTPGIEIYFEGVSEKISNEALLKILVKEFRDCQPMNIALMLFGLKALGFITRDLKSNVSQLHRHLTKTFGSVGNLNTLNGNLNKFSDSDPEVRLMKVRLEKLIS